MAARVLEPEWLDALAPEDPRAIRSRRDLRVINSWMRQSAIMAHALARHCAADGPRRLMDLGSGDGTFLLRVARRLPRWRHVTALLVDQRDIVTSQTRAAFAGLGWRVESIATDAREILRAEAADVITANLFLHHLTTEELRPLFIDASRSASLLVACEPRRNAVAHLASRMIWALGCNDVSRHDAAVSVRAGFRGRELSALWPALPEWRLREFAALPFTHCFVAQRSGVVP
jgi:hypothetical protein